MHGHGSRPHLCHFTDCERSVPGNGFPRRYNLFDHMKRVHDFTGPPAEPSPSSQGPTGTSRKSTSRKRKSTAEEGTEKRQKVSKPTPEQQRQQKREQLGQDFSSRVDSLMATLRGLSGPADMLKDDIQLHEEIGLLEKICAQYKSLG